MFRKQPSSIRRKDDLSADKDKAQKALEMMKALEEERAGEMTTIVASDGTVISSTNEQWLKEWKRMHDRRIRLY